MKYLLACFLTCCVLLNLSSCVGPVSKVLSDPKKFAQVADSVFARGLCLNDTVTTTLTKDSLVYRDTTITKMVQVNTPGICRIDTMVNGQHIVLADGVITVTNTTPCKDRLRTVTKTNTVRDQSREQVYLKQVRNGEERLRLNEIQRAKAQATATLRSWQLIIALILLAGTGFVAVKKTFLL